MPLMRLRRALPDILLCLLLLLAPLAMFHQQTIGGRTLLPSENLYQALPYSAYRELTQAPASPHNHLLSDMVLQNMQWKHFLRAQLAQRELPLWNPQLFAGIPFFAAGQHSALYPLSLVYYLLPLDAAYGWFILLNLWLAGLFMAGYMRALAVGRAGAALAGLVYQLCGFMIANAVFPMIVAAAAWLPLILWMIENILQRRPLRRLPQANLLWSSIGALAIACNSLAGHIEISLYTWLICAFVALFRLICTGLSTQREQAARTWRWLATSSSWLLLLAISGLGLAALQLVPLYELAQGNWRAERASLQTVLSYAHPPRDLLQFFLPNVYGGPAIHSYTDIFSGAHIHELRNAAGERIDYIDWGIKNAVEGALYLGILPLLLAAYALLDGLRRRRLAQQRLLFALVLLLSLAFMFGSPLYGILYRLPGINQLNTPFRWVFALSLAIAALAGIGLDQLARQANCQLAQRMGKLCIVGSAALAAAVVLCWALYERLAAVFDQLVIDLLHAERAFADGSMFASFLLPQLLLLAVLLLGAGILLLWAARGAGRRWLGAALLLVFADLLLASYGFNPASDPALLDFRPPSIEFLQGQARPFRITSLQRPGDPAILPPNTGMQFGLDELRGYDSIIPAGTVATLRALQPQPLLPYNQIAPILTAAEHSHSGYEQLLQSGWLSLLNLRYIMTVPDFELQLPGWRAVFRQEVTIWENEHVMPRAFAIDKRDWDGRWLAADSASLDPRQRGMPPGDLQIPAYLPATITRDTSREKFIDISLNQPSWLVISESFMPGWRAFARPWTSDEDAEFNLAVHLAFGNLQAVELPPGDWTLRMIYSPASVQVGMFASSISTAWLLFLLGAWLWRTVVGMNSAESSSVARVARNSIAPILLNLFNRGIDMVFAIVMYRLLPPADVGIYNFAVVLFVAFDIFTNFGLDLLLIRELAQKRRGAAPLLLNTSTFRFALSVLGAPLLAGMLLLWQASGAEAIGGEGLLAIGLLYIGLFPASLSKGLTSLFYAHEQAEKPAAIATITTMNKAVLGLIVLLLGYGIVGLAALSIANNLLTLLVLLWASRKLIGRFSLTMPDFARIRSMAGESLPLMLNHFLATVFFQVDIVILQALKGAATVAQYSTAYKWLLALNIVPAFFTQALFPVLSRQAVDDPAAFSRSLRFGLKLLFSLSLPLAVAFTALAEPLTLLLAGSRYLPDGAIALQLMIWSIPIGWMNSLSQYALVALGLQRLITRAFLLAVAGNIAANLLFIPQYGFQAAALATIASELLLCLPFLFLLRRHVPGLQLLALLWRSLLALALMLLLYTVLGQSLLALLLAIGAYATVIFLLRPLDTAEGAALLSLLPPSLRAQPALRWLARQG